MTPTTWVGVDPGSTETGIVTRRGTHLLWHAVIVRDHDEDHGQGVGVGPGYLSAVLAAVNTARYLAAGPAGIAVELVVPPTAYINGKRKFTNPEHAIATGIVLGAVLARHPDAVRVRPDSHGKGALLTYPAALVTHGERRLGLQRPAGDSALIHHCRSAWDVAGQGATLARGATRQQLLTAIGGHR